MNRKISKLTKSRQSNHLIESPHEQEFTVHEIKLFEIAVASCVSEDSLLIENKQDKEFYLSTKELAELLNTSVYSISTHMERTALGITSKRLYLINPNNPDDFHIINIIPEAKYENGILFFRFNYAIIKYVLNINKNFTEFQLGVILNLNSAYAIKIYKLLLQYKTFQKRIFDVQELKKQLGVLDKYKEYRHFRQRILNPSIDEINKKTGLNVGFKEIKFGRAVHKIEFNFTAKVIVDVDNNGGVSNINLLENQTQVNPDLQKLIESIHNKISKSTENLIMQYYESHGIDYVSAAIEYTRLNSKKSHDKYLQDTLIKNWSETLFKETQEKKSKVKSTTDKRKEEELKRQKSQELEVQRKIQVEQAYAQLESNQEYKEYASKILTKYKHELKVFSKSVNLEDVLPVCIYAVNNNMSYNSSIEAHCKHMCDNALTIQ